MIFYDFSGGMESAAMLWIERNRIRETGAIVRFADTGKHFPEMYQSIRQVSDILGVEIIIVPRRITFDEYLFERGGMLRKGMNDCSRRMKRSNLTRHMKSFEPPYEVNLGFNAEEQDRADAFIDRNERDWLHWRFPLIEHGITRAMTRPICEEAAFTIILDIYRKMGRFDCFWCPNQSDEQALKVVDHYPELAKEWAEAEEKKGHSFLPVPLKVLVDYRDRQGQLFCQAKCGCFGGNDDMTEDLEDVAEFREQAGAMKGEQGE